MATVSTSVRIRRGIAVLTLGLLATVASGEPAAPLRVGVFDVDASPPVGSPLAYDPCTAVETPLSCRGIVPPSLRATACQGNRAA